MSLNSNDLQSFMTAHATPGEILHLSVPTPTVETAARALGVRVEQIVKSILFLVEGSTTPGSVGAGLVEVGLVGADLVGADLVGADLVEAGLVGAGLVGAGLVGAGPRPALKMPVLAIACGTAYVDRRLIAAHFAVGNKRLRLASPEEVLAISGYAVGAMPPFGHRQPLLTLLDRRVLDQPIVYAGGGEENAMLRLDPQDIARVSAGVIMDLTGLPHHEKE